MTESEGTDIACLTAKCSKILEVLEEGRKTAREITGHGRCEEAMKAVDKPDPSDQLSNLRRLVDRVAWGVGVLADQLNRIQNQL